MNVARVMALQRLAVTTLGVAMAFFVPSALGAQERVLGGLGSSYLPLDHWAYDYLDVLVARGRLNTLSPLIQPYRRVEVAAAVRRALGDELVSVTERAWLEDLLDELAYERQLLSGDSVQDLRFGWAGEAGAKGITQLHRDVLRPEGDGEVFALLQLDLAVDAPRLAAGFSMRWDNHLLNDPQFPEGRVVEFRECDPFVDQCGYRVDEGYVEVQIPYVKLFFGRLNRNWGLPGTMGLLVSDYPYSYDHVAYTFGNEKLSLRGLLNLPNDFPGDTSRFFASHRLDWRIRDNLVIGLGESIIYGGPDDELEFSLINPVGIWEISGTSGTGERNTLGSAEVWWRPFAGMVVFGSLLVDNTMVGEPGNKEGLTQWASVLGLQLPSLAPSWAVRADLSIVNSLAYRSRVGPVESYAIEGIGLAHDKTDAIVLSLNSDWFLSRRLVLKPQLHIQWKGEDDLRTAWPDTAFSTHPGIHVGTVEHTIRPAVGGRWRIGPASISWDVGFNLIENRDHMPSDWIERFESEIKAVIRKSFLN